MLETELAVLTVANCDANGERGHVQQEEVGSLRAAPAEGGNFLVVCKTKLD
jgi:hypothetical protein